MLFRSIRILAAQLMKKNLKLGTSQVRFKVIKHDDLQR